MHPKIKSLVKPIYAAVLPFIPWLLQRKLKGYLEYRFWRKLYKKKGLHNGHFPYFFTDFFGLKSSWYENKKVLDIGCGPCGSLEWANTALLRIGLDPEVCRYWKLGIHLHKMNYVNGLVEGIPFRDASFDLVSSFNSLDHVDHVDTALSEIIRVLKPSAHLLLILEVNHDPRPTEPVEIREAQLKQKLIPHFELISWIDFAIRADHDIYQSLLDSTRLDSLANDQPGIVAAHLIKNSQARKAQ